MEGLWEDSPLGDATIFHPRMISIPADAYCELGRWTLDRLGVPYVEECHVPGLYRRATGGNSKELDVPIVDIGETFLLNAREVLDYYEARCPPLLKIYPSDRSDKDETSELFNYLVETFGVAVRAWNCAHMLPLRRVTARVWKTGSPWWERLAVDIFYPLLANAVSRRLKIDQDTVSKQQKIIEGFFTQVESRLADGRPFLMGKQLTVADLAFAALAFPIVLPHGFGSPIPALEELPQAMKSVIEAWRARPAGQFVLRLYRENRPLRAPDLVAEGKHGSGRTFLDRLLNALIAPGVLRPLFAMLRSMFPILILGKCAIVSRYDDVKEVLKRDREFTIREINEHKIQQIDGPFILGMDASEQYDRESAVLRRAVRQEDLAVIRAFVAKTAIELIQAAKLRRRIDVVNGYARVVPIRLLESYFGIPVPNDPTMMRWMRDEFHFIFADLTNAPSVLQDALKSSAELRRYMDEQIAFRKSLTEPRPQEGTVDRLLAVQETENSLLADNVLQIDRHHGTAAEDKSDNFLGRLLAQQGPGNSWLDDNAVRRNLGGVIVGSVDTTSKFVTLAMDELLRRPKALAEARAAALAGNIETVRRYTWEAVRFNPHHPLQARYCPKDSPIAAGLPRSKTVPAGSSVYVGTLSAMFDPDVFKNPEEFNPSRDVDYLHFGYGMHTCFGLYINNVQIPELVAGLLRLPNLRRVAGSAGKILYDGPFPNRLVLEFDA